MTKSQVYRIERLLREQIAKEIEAQCCELGHKDDYENMKHEVADHAYKAAAAIARGKTEMEK